MSRQFLLQPRLQGLSNEDKLAIKDAFLKEGIEAHALSLDILSLLIDVEEKTGAAKRAVSSNSSPAPATK